MIKCRHCGSTAQVRLKDKPQINESKGCLTETFCCGCGCEWEIHYERHNDKTGYWDISMEIITPFKEKPKGHIHCPCNGTDCPYWEKGICSLYSAELNWQDPMKECGDFGMFWDEDDDYIDYD